jgi:hypothetical protein
MIEQRIQEENHDIRDDTNGTIRFVLKTALHTTSAGADST